MSLKNAICWKPLQNWSAPQLRAQFFSRLDISWHICSVRIGCELEFPLQQNVFDSRLESASLAWSTANVTFIWLNFFGGSISMPWTTYVCKCASEYGFCVCAAFCLGRKRFVHAFIKVFHDLFQFTLSGLKPSSAHVCDHKPQHPRQTVNGLLWSPPIGRFNVNQFEVYYPRRIEFGVVRRLDDQKRGSPIIDCLAELAKCIFLDTCLHFSWQFRSVRNVLKCCRRGRIRAIANKSDLMRHAQMTLAFDDSVVRDERKPDDYY